MKEAPRRMMVGLTHRRLLWTGELQNLGAQVGALDCTQVLLIALPVACVLEQHVRIASLHLHTRTSPDPNPY